MARWHMLRTACERERLASSVATVVGCEGAEVEVSISPQFGAEPGKKMQPAKLCKEQEKTAKPLFLFSIFYLICCFITYIINLFIV